MVSVSPERGGDPVDDPGMLVLSDRSDTRCEAAIDVEVEAGDTGVTAGTRPLAGPKLEHALRTSRVSRTFFAFAYGPK